MRWSGLAAIVGGVLGIVMTPILSYLWATYSDLYGYFGRAYFLVVLGCMAGVAGLFAQRGGNSGLRGTEELQMEKLVIGITSIGLAIAFVGTVLDYWGGRPGEDFTQAQITGFGFEIIGILLALLGSVLLGLAYRTTDVMPRSVPWLLVAAGPLGLLSSWVHIPSGAMLPFCCVWLVLGYLLLTGRIPSAAQPPEASRAPTT